MGGTNTCCGVACSSVGAQASACCLYSVLEYRTSYLHCPEITEAERRREWVSFWYDDIKWELYRREERGEGRGEGVGRGKWGITCSNCSSWLYQPWQATTSCHVTSSWFILCAPASPCLSVLVCAGDQWPATYRVHFCPLLPHSQMLFSPRSSSVNWDVFLLNFMIFLQFIGERDSRSIVIFLCKWYIFSKV